MKPNRSVRMPAIILALGLALALSGCSAIKLGYANLPELLYWWLDGYADFSDAQAPRMRDELARLHRWHRQQELPPVVDVLARMEALAPGDITPQQACGVVADAQARLRAAAHGAGPAAGAIAASFSDAQLRHIERRFRRSNDKFRKESVDVPPAEAHEKRYEQMLDRLETVYGRLGDAQRQVLRDGVAQSAYDAARILADRQRRQQDLLQTLRHVSRARMAPEEARGQLLAWLDRAMHSPDAAYRTWQEGLVQEGCRMFAAVHRSTTAAQREHAVRRLQAYQRDLRELSAQPQ
ncbi:hypothetical protein H8N03_17100 [Ramlibacter sp. USB13]|uniref:Lipoprotein n=1 Tax=Ramlibacter cellulosilyticus TaxID=2764187 RepID=A0A923MUZ6_9BURK|nr:DUF6279 family lipoprotein [Ramlibacter cellulosilyticus]MBC5784669.1 hypothetical protein [Ramlibacter cellulosilyticus]